MMSLDRACVCIDPPSMTAYFLCGSPSSILEPRHVVKIFIPCLKRRWLELIKDYDLEIHYHPDQANAVADAFSRKAHCNCQPVVSISGEESSI
jgi:hypothetical protein